MVMLKGELWWADLPKENRTSVVNFSQIVTVDKTFIREYVCTLPKSFTQRIDQSLKIVFDIQA
jgi:mRNA-degrading endonuclease toxin of MazEF toxin-antitoxin module